MSVIRATVRDGRIETDEPIDLPDGTELTLYPLDGIGPDQDVDLVAGTSPEAIAAWMREYEKLEPLILTNEERAEIEKAMAEQKAWELAHFDEHAEKLRKMWE